MFSGLITPEWFKSRNLQNEYERIRKLNVSKDEKAILYENFKTNILKIPSIKSVEIKDTIFGGKKVKITPRVGIMKTSIGYGIGKDSNTFKTETGYSNYFKKNEVFKAKLESTFKGKPMFSVEYNQPLIENSDFSDSKNPFSTFIVRAEYQKNEIKKSPVHVGTVSAVYKPKKRNQINSLSFSLTYEDRDVKAPLPFLLDQSPYAKISLKTEFPSIIPSNSCKFELNTLCLDKKLTPFIKSQGSYNLKLPYNFNIFLAGGAILSTKAVPTYEKFRIGGVPFARGIKEEEFGTMLFGFPCGSDYYLSSTVSLLNYVLPECQLNSHIFLNGALAGVRKSNNFLEQVPNISKLLSIGLGLTLSQGPFNIELNTQMPIIKTDDLEFMNFQFGISSIND